MTAAQVAPPQPLAKRIRKALNKWWKGRRAAIEGWVDSKSLIETTEIIPSERFPWVAHLEANWETIRRELDAVMPQRDAMPAMDDISPMQKMITKDKAWKVFMFRVFGSKSDDNCRKCPETAKLLDAIPNCETAFFSVLAPGAHITAHHGAYKGLVRTHLGLIVPEPNDKVRMAVGREMIHWREGKAVVFDDTFRHEVWNDTNGIRVVLLIDVERPFPPVLRGINRFILRLARTAPSISGAIKRMQSSSRPQAA